jgi:predicted 3-demethylubiquinone-9 3-methyltransferase (glyoxalase superfamily)
MPSITPNLSFDTQALEAAECSTSVFPNSEITHVMSKLDLAAIAAAADAVVVS